MPRGNRTGPTGEGPMTGRQAGYCAGYDMPGYANPAPRRGADRGRGRGGRGRRGWRHWFQATGLPGWQRFGYAPNWEAPPPSAYASQMTEEQEAEHLRTQAEWLGEQLDAINQRLADIEKKA